MRLRHRTTSLVASVILGGICGGPIGMLVAKLIHSGLVVKIGLEVGGLCGGAVLANRVHRNCYTTDVSGSESEALLQEPRVTFNLTPQYKIIPPREDDTTTELEFKRLVAIVETEPNLVRSHRNIIGRYHRQVSDGTCPLDACTSALADFNNTLLITYQPLQDFSVVDLTIYAERILMMSVYEGVWRRCCHLEGDRDNKYQTERHTKNEYPNIPTSIISEINRLPSRKTASLKMASLSQAYTLLNSYAASHLSLKQVDCDTLIPMFTSAVVQSNLQHPLAELMFMRHFLPDRLLGKESYILSTWEAVCLYIIS